MQDTKVMLELLQLMANMSDKKVLVRLPHAPKKKHEICQLELLCKKGLAERIGNGCYRITDVGEETLLRSKPIGECQPSKM